jgi:LmbE family N-acetylglucosaminyl deacetylase
MTRQIPKILVVLVLFSLAPLPVSGQVGVAPAALEPPSTGGVAAVERALDKLSTHKRLLVIAAHPDDEDTSLLTLVSRGMGGESAYLSLSRGEGGQNLIGPELGMGLGLIRSRELLAARGVDGGRQFFSRAYDFGFTRSLEETLRLWPREVLLEDAVRVIRRFKPQVVVSVFPGVPSPTHGQHQAAGVTAHEAFPLAGDPAFLPDLAPWTPQALYRSTFFDRDATTLVMPTSGVDPLSGRSIYQIAMASRSMHRSQDMGQLQRLGPQETRVGWVKGGAGVEAKDLFAGVDTSLPGVAAPIPDPERRRHVGEHLEAVQVAAERARGALNPEKLDAAVPEFLEILKHLRAVRAFLAEKDVPEERPVLELVDEKLEVAEAGLAAAAGVAVDAATEREALTAGEAFAVQAVLWNSGGRAVAKASVSLIPAPEWGGEPLAGEAKELAAGALGTWDLQPTIPAGAPPTVPYFLQKPLAGSLYDWTGVPAAVRGEPFGPPPLVARFAFTLDGVPVTLEREVVYRQRDQALGEVRRPIRVVPRVEVAEDEEILVWPVQRREPRRLHVTLASRSKTPLRGRLEGKTEGGASSWPAIAPLPFAIAAEGEEAGMDLTLTPPKDLKPGRYTLRLAAVPEDGGRFDLAVPVIDYPHIRPTPRPEPASVEIVAADVALPPLQRVGYVRGASDRVPEFLRQVGVPLEILGPKELADGDLSRYDAIVVGSRAYETDPALARANGRVLDYARNGGLVIVQYQQYPFIEGKFAPLPLEIARPHDRITDETAPVTVLDPAHPVFTTPNRIGPEDWNGWIQERGLYFAHTWDPAYVPLLAMTDPDQPEQRGGLLVAKLGKGHYVYTGIAFFRELPAGVPGAYRLFANLLALVRNAGAQ